MLPYTVIDVFTDVPLQGNQLGVFTDPRQLSAEQMQRLAKEMNFAECVLVLPAEKGGAKGSEKTSGREEAALGEEAA